jgi:hypothetical protein
MADAPIHLPHPLPTHPPIQRATPTYDKLGHYVSAQVLCSDGSNWTISFPPYPTISPISFTQLDKTPFTVSFAVDADSFTFAATYENEQTVVRVQATGFPKWDVTVDGYTESVSSFPDLISTVYTPFSKKFTLGLIGNISLLRDTCATARALMMPANVDTTDPGDSYLTAAVAMNLIPPGLQIGVENLASIATVAETVMTTEPISYPLTTATDFFFGTAAGVYETLINAINPYLKGEGSDPSPIPEPFPDGNQPSKPPKPIGIKGH